MSELHDRWEPKLRVAASGLGGSGYRIPTRTAQDGKPLLVPGVTTVLGVLDKGGIVQWAVDNTAAYAAANVEALLNREPEQRYGFLRWYHSRMKSRDFDNPEIDITDYSNGVLNDLAELGTMTHDWIADFVNDYFTGDLTRDAQVEMVNKFLEWWEAHDVQVVASEITVVGEDNAGTLDHIWIIDGVPTLLDVKTARKMRFSHYAQLGALGAANYYMREVASDYPGAVEYETKKWGKTYWVEEPIPAFTQYAILHLRPSDTTSRGEYLEPFCELHVIPQEKIEAGFRMFQGALCARLAERDLKKLEKEEL